MQSPRSLNAPGALMIQPSEFPSYSRCRRPAYNNNNAKRHSQSYSRTESPLRNVAMTPCPEDTDAFSFFPRYLAEWHMPQVLWDALPDHLHKPLAALQRAGAAAMTSFHRLEGLQQELNGKLDEDNSELRDEAPTRTPSLTSLASLPTAPSSSSPSPQQRIATPSTPVTPLDLGLGFDLMPPQHESKLDMTDAAASRPLLFSARSWSFSHYTPPAASPSMARWRAEASVLREETIVRVRHALRKIEGEWRALLQQQQQHQQQQQQYHHRSSSSNNSSSTTLPAEDALDDNDNTAAWLVLTSRFAQWLEQKKAAVQLLEARTRALGEPVYLGWMSA